MTADPTGDHARAAGAHWSEEVDELLGGDLAVMSADVTPAHGVVLTPLTNFGLRDRHAGTMTLLSSVGAWRKLARMRRNPKVAVVFHTRQHGYANGSRYVLVQGDATFTLQPDRAWLESIDANWERFMGPRDRGLPWEWWTRVYQWERIGIDIAVHRVITWPDLRCRGKPDVHGSALPELSVAAQKPPARGTASRIDAARAAKRIARLPDALLGWEGADGYPFVVPVTDVSASDGALSLCATEGLLPPGGRRAGLSAHWFSERVLGQEQRVHTGWLQTGPAGRNPVYAPHTEIGYRLPPSKLLYRLLVGGLTRYGLYKAKRSGFLAEQP
jgi:hypothetical protein